MKELVDGIFKGIIFIIAKCWKLLVVLIPIAALIWGTYSALKGREIQSLPLPDLYPPTGH